MKKRKLRPTLMNNLITVLKDGLSCLRKYSLSEMIIEKNDEGFSMNGGGKRYRYRKSLPVPLRKQNPAFLRWDA
jgi:hypothetical protein